VSLTDEVKDFALDLGYHAVGVTSADSFPLFAECFAERAGDYPGYRFLSDWADPHRVLPEARSIVVAAYDYFTKDFPAELVGRIGRIYQARCYLAPADRLHGARAELLRGFLERRGCRVAPWSARRSGIPDRQAGARAGVTRFGRNTFACAPGVGTFVMIQSFVVDASLDRDAPHEGVHCPPKCELCRDACPTGAIVDDLRLDPRRCIAYNTFATRGGDSGVSPSIPRSIRPLMGAWVHGCDVCQEVCPRNQAKLRADLPPDPYLLDLARAFSLKEMLRLTEAYRARVVQPLMYNYIREPSLFRRNAAVALGNAGDGDAVPDLVVALEDPAEVVRAHAAWALGRIGGARAVRALETHRTRETDATVVQEIGQALEEMV
jgi:epoxyqueuosine reductase